MYLVGARPGVGKSSFSAQLLLELAKNDQPGLFLSQEMPEEEVADRAVAAGGVNYGNLQSGKMSDDDWSKAVALLENLKGVKVWIDDQPALTLSDIRNKIALCPGVKVVVLDYLQLCSRSSNTSASNRNSEIEEISRGLKNLSKELGIAVIVLSQLNREVEKRADKRPFLSDLRDSGSLEQDADVVFFLWPVADLPTGEKIVGLGIDKNRQGSKTDIALRFNGAYQQWAEDESPISQHKSKAQPVKQTTYQA
jgi:replicative DNA helicase